VHPTASRTSSTICPALISTASIPFTCLARSAMAFDGKGNRVIGLQMLDDKLRQVADVPAAEADRLRHMLVSHHGSQEFGSPEPPKTIEALLLHYIDEIDSKINAVRDFMAKDDAGGHWTSYHRVLGRHFYLGGGGDGPT